MNRAAGETAVSLILDICSSGNIARLYMAVRLDYLRIICWLLWSRYSTVAKESDSTSEEERMYEYCTISLGR
jgi:hypothetical protein